MPGGKVALVALAIGWSQGTFAQESRQRAAVHVHVVDSMSASLPGVRVVLRESGRSDAVSITIVTDGKGDALFGLVLSGDYEITCDLPQFRLNQPAHVRVSGQTVHVSLKMELEPFRDLYFVPTDTIGIMSTPAPAIDLTLRPLPVGRSIASIWPSLEVQ